jgi:hypothetical protein
MRDSDRRAPLGIGLVLAVSSILPAPAVEHVADLATRDRGR